VDENGKTYILKPVEREFKPPTAENLENKKRKKKPPHQMRLHPTSQVKDPDEIRRYGQWCISSQVKKKKAKLIGGLASV